MDSLVLFRNEKTVPSCKSEVLGIHCDCGRALLGTNGHCGVIQWANIRSYTTEEHFETHTICQIHTSLWRRAASVCPGPNTIAWYWKTIQIMC